MMDKPVSFYAFEMLYWCGIREGELLALTRSDSFTPVDDVPKGLILTVARYLLVFLPQIEQCQSR